MDLPESTNDPQDILGEATKTNSEQPLVILCGAKTKVGSICQRRPLPGQLRCHLHRAEVPNGTPRPKAVRNTSFKHGGYTAHLPTHLRDSYKQIAQSMDLLTHEHDIALMQVRANELVARLASGESGDRWKQIKTHVDAFRDANNRAAKAGDPDERLRCQGEAIEAWQTIEKLVNDGVQDEINWAELQRTIEFKSRLQQKEWERLNAMNNVATGEQVRVLMLAVANSVLRHVGDANTRRAIVSDIELLGVFDLAVASPFPDGFTNDHQSQNTTAPVVRVIEPPRETPEDSKPVDAPSA